MYHYNIGLFHTTAEMKWQYKEEKPFDVRRTEADAVREKHPDRIPVIVEKVASSRIADLDRKKFLVPSDLTVAQFMHVLRQRIQLDATESIFLMINGVQPATSESMIGIYHQHKDEDGFLYVAYSGENTMGNN